MNACLILTDTSFNELHPDCYSAPLENISGKQILVTALCHMSDTRHRRGLTFSSELESYPSLLQTVRTHGGSTIQNIVIFVGHDTSQNFSFYTQLHS